MFDRRQDRNMRRVIFLSVEGTKTEVEYFGYINKYKTSLGVESIVEIHVLKRDDTKSSPEQVLDLLDEYMSLKNSIDFSVSFYNYHEPSIYPCL